MSKAGRPVEPIMLTDEEERELERRLNASTSSKRDSERAEIVLLRSRGLKQEEVGISHSSVQRIWKAEGAKILEEIQSASQKLEVTK